MVVIWLALSASIARAVLVAWDTVPDCDYKLYYGRSSRVYDRVDYLSTNYFQINATDRPLYIAVTAVSRANGLESEPSTELVYYGQIVYTAYIESVTNLSSTNWTMKARFVVTNLVNGQEFIRVRLDPPRLQ